ncbi:MAG: hypothetical protein DMF93_16095 [Acidobacteria bacterium]|nr:MAG: hypothetical protein DMF93_16095 [Acidobacteriota bacterium]
MKTLASLLFFFVSVSNAQAQSALTVVTLNTNHGAQAPWSVADQVAAIVTASPDVVLLQEAHRGQLDQYVAAINAGLGSTAWHGVAAKHCVAGSAPQCTAPTEESVMVLSRLPFVETESRLIWARDDYFVARAALRAAMRLDDGSAVQVFGVHLPPLADAAASRASWVVDFLRWADTRRGPTIVGGDFNDVPSSPPIAAMSQRYVDAWAAKGGGDGATHSRNGRGYVRRLDYLFSSGLDVSAASVPAVAVSDHRPVVATFTLSATARVGGGGGSPDTPAPGGSFAALLQPQPASPDGDAVLLEDDFDGDAPDPATWPAGIVSGTEDPTLPVAQAGGALVIGPLRASASGFHYNGPSSQAIDLSASGYAQVQLLQGVVGDQANAMFTAASNSTNFYRIYQAGAAGSQRIAAEKKIDDQKSPLASAPYDPALHQILRIRRDYRPDSSVDDVVFETSPAAPAARAFVELYRERWDPRVQAQSLTFEIKAGTSDKEASPGTAVWDHFRVALVAP